MRLIFSILTLLLICSCEQKAKNNSSAGSKTDKIVGTYHYVYPHNTPDLIEDHFIILTRSGKSIAGRYYGTRDEFDQNREGYYPGFFVATMNNIVLTDNSISFNLSIDTSEIFTRAIPL